MSIDSKTETAPQYSWTFAPTAPSATPALKSQIILAVSIAVGLLMFVAFALGKSGESKQVEALRGQLQAEKERSQELNNSLYDARLQLTESASDRAQLQTIRELICKE